jgi:hypothetical protein
VAAGDGQSKSATQDAKIEKGLLMKKKNVTKGKVVEVYAAFPNEGAYYSGAKGKVLGPHTVDGEQSKLFFSVKMGGSNDVVVVHPKQLRESV